MRFVNVHWPNVGGGRNWDTHSDGFNRLKQTLLPPTDRGLSALLDDLSRRPRLHGLQVGVATYLMSLVQEQNTETIARLFDATGFWRSIEAAPFDRREWIEAVRAAPGMKADYYTIFSSRDCLPEIEHAIDTDPRLQRCFARSD